MSDTGPATSNEAPAAAEATMSTVAADAAEEMKDFAIWLRLDSKPGKNVHIPRLRPLTYGYGPGLFLMVDTFASLILDIQQAPRLSAFC